MLHCTLSFITGVPDQRGALCTGKGWRMGFPSVISQLISCKSLYMLIEDSSLSQATPSDFPSSSQEQEKKNADKAVEVITPGVDALFLVRHTDS